MPSVVECREKPGSLAGLGCPQNNTKLPMVQFPELKANKQKQKPGWRAQWLKRLPHKHEDLHSDPQNPEKSGLGSVCCHPIVPTTDRRQRWENPQNYGTVILLYPDAIKRPCLKQEAKRSLTPEVVFWSPYDTMHANRNIHAHTENKGKVRPQICRNECFVAFSK